MARGDGALRLRQARRALRPRARRPRRGVRGHRVPRVPGRRGEGHPSCPARATCRARSSTGWSTGPSSSAPPGWCGCGYGATATLESPVAKFLSRGEQLGLVDALGAAPGDLLLVAAGTRRLVDHVLGTLRLDLGRPPVHEGGLHFLWVVDFPLFEALDDDGRPIPAHHPFTMPHPDDLELLEHGTGEDLLAVRSLAYDLVLNGWELGSGSVRIHRPDVQQQIFALLGIDRRGRAGALRLPARRVPLRRAAARGLRVRHRPARRDPRGRGEHPRGDRVPEDAVGRRPAHRRARPPIDDAQLARARPPHRPPADRRSPNVRRSVASGGGRRSLRRRGRGPARAAGAARGPAAAAVARRGRRPGAPARAGRPLRVLIEADRLSSVILWGPPGTGKTTIARLIAGATAKAFEPLSAVSAGVKDVREVAERARARLGEHGQGTILFLDEVHRFSRDPAGRAAPARRGGPRSSSSARPPRTRSSRSPARCSRARTLFRLEPLEPRRPRRARSSARSTDADRGLGARAARRSTTTRASTSSTAAKATPATRSPSLEVAAALAVEDGRDTITLERRRGGARAARAALRRRRALRRRLRVHQEHPRLRSRRRALLARADARSR